MPATPPAPALPASVVAIGNFDGVHRGHRAVLAALAAAAERHRAPSCVYTFDPAPTAVVAPERHQPRLQTVAARVAALRAAGVEHVVVERFTPEFAAQPAERFVAEVLGARLGARALIVGHDFRFGNMRAGNAEAIRRLAPSIEVVEVGALAEGAEPISSSRIRRAVAAGAVRLAADLLGRPFRLSGRVVQGDQRGRTLGFPTANLAADEEVRPAAGVYAAYAGLADGRRVPAVVNLGVRPTVGGERYAIEAHLLGFSGDLYGEPLALDFVERLRDERRFPSLDALVAQIRQDVADARRWLP